jgi:CRISPR/Cas system-associated exonuclease Cas4 (RecB family)
MIQLFESSSSRERLTAAGTFVRSCPPASEVLIVGASRPAVDDFVRGLSVRRLAGRGATFGLHRFSFMQLVARLATSELARNEQTPATPLGVEAVAARATFEGVHRAALPHLEKAAEFPGFARALASTVGELRLAGLDSAATGDADGSGAADGAREPRDLALLHGLFEEELGKASIADRPAMLRLAIRGLDELRDLRTAPVLLLDVAIGSALEREFLGNLLARSKAVFATVPAGDRETVTALDAIGPVEPFARDSKSRRVTSLSRLQSFLFSDDKPPQRELDESVRFFSAPGEARECVEIARQIVRATRNEVAFDEIAVFLRAPELYSAHLETAFRRAGIPAYFARGTKRPDPSGRAFLALLACKTEGLSAKRFSEYLSFSQVPDLEPDGAPPAGRETWVGSDEESLGAAANIVQLALFPKEPTEATAAAPADDGPQVAGTLRAPWKWEEYLVEAAVIGGRDRWRRRLAGLENELKMKLERLAAEEPESPRIPAFEREITNLGHLERFALPIIDALDDFPDRATWGEWLRILSDLAPSVLRRPDRVLGVLAEMHPMAAVGPLTIEEVSSVLAERLSTLEKEQPASRFGRVYVATPDAARGRSFRVVFVPGLAERVFPRRPREDPLLLDARRLSLSDGLRTQIGRGHEERMLLQLAVGAAEDRVVLSYPRVDVVEARPRVPSFYGLDVARATRGHLPDHEELEREADSVTNARLAWPAPPAPADAIDAVEHDLSTLRKLLDESRPSNVKGRARYLLEMNDHLARSLRSRWIRWRAKAWAPEDGLVRTTERTAPALASQRPSERPYSVTALQRYAACPYQFLLAAIHRLEPRREAVALVQLDPLTRGSMVHEIQAETLRALKDANALPVRPGGLADATAVLDDTLDVVETKYREDLAPAILRVWQDEVGAIRGDLRVWLKMMSEDEDWVPEHFEFAFGLRDRFDAADSLPDPVILPGGWKLRGAVDLIERRPGDGHLRVTDHKTGAHPPSEGTIVGGGEILQPALYSLAVEKALPGTVESARLFFCTSRGRFTEVNIPLHDFARHYANQVMEIVDRAVESGTLPPAPRKNACAWCDFRAVCGPSEEIRAGRKAPALIEDLRALRGLP